MARYMPDRDQYGRFVSDDDRGRGRYRDDDDRHRSMASRYDDDRRSSSRRYDDDDRYDRGEYSRDRGQGGWFGDPRGHAEAAREGCAHRRGDDDYDRDRYRDYDRRRSMSRYDDDDRRYSSSRYDDRDDRGGYSRDRGQGGWFGDPRGHAEASRLGWEHRRGDDDDDRYRRR